MSRIGYREVCALVMEALARDISRDFVNDRGFHTLAQSVVSMAIAKKLIETNGLFQGQPTSFDEPRVRELVRQAMWGLLAKGILVFGLNEQNPNWPWYRLTDLGKEALKANPPQPYDPDGFIAYFKRACGSTDPTVEAYVVEAVHAFNSGCNKAAAVMLGCASEKLVLLLTEAFEDAIADASKKLAFQRAIGRKWAISHKYKTLKEHLDLMVDGRKLPPVHAETVGSELPSGFELLRRSRNAGGHPDVPGDVDADTIFLNLRTFTEYAKRVGALVDHFKNTPADW